MCSSRRKSWKTMPMRRRSCARFDGRDARDVLAQHVDRPPRRLDGHEQQPQQRGLARARRPGEEVEGPGPQMERHVVQHFAAATVSQPYSVQSDHARTLVPSGSRGHYPQSRQGGRGINGQDCGGVMGPLHTGSTQLDPRPRAGKRANTVLGFRQLQSNRRSWHACARAGAKEGLMARILLADDDAATRDLVTRALATDGHTVDTTQDGSEALEKLQEAPTGYDLLITRRADAGARRHRARRAGAGRAPDAARAAHVGLRRRAGPRRSSQVQESRACSPSRSRWSRSRPR